MAAPSIPFSYAQAAKGMSSAVASPKEPSTHPSGSSTPSKHQDSLLTQIPPPAAPLEEKSRGEKEEDARKSEQGHEESTMEVSQSKASQDMPTGVNGAPTPPSPEYGISSLSTLAKDDDASSVQQESSESTWDKKSQASIPAETSTESAATVIADATEDKNDNKVAEKDNDPAKPLREAPTPVVNIWQMRADAAKAKAAAQPTVPKASVPRSTSSVQKGPGDKENSYPKQKGRATEEDHPSRGKDRKQVPGANTKATGEDKPYGRRELRNQTDEERDRRNMGRSTDRQTSAPIMPPSQDVASWPTPDTAKDGDRKKTEKSDKERPGGSSAKPHGKSDWVPVPFTPSVVFNTPLPNSNSRRGGRGGNRGGRDTGGRSASNIPGGNSEKATASASSTPDNDQSKRGKGDIAAARSPVGKGRKGAGAETTTQREAGTASLAAPQPSGMEQANSSEQRPAKSSDHDSRPVPTQSDGQQNGHPAKSANRPRQNRRFDGPSAPYPNEKRRDGDVAATSNGASGGSQARGAPAVVNVDENGERRSLPAGESYTHSKANHERRNGTYPPYSNRERGRGGMRGGRNGSHGHQQSHHGPHPPYSGGQMGGINSSASYSIPTSPTSFRQDSQGGFYGQQQPQHSRGYRNPARSQSIPVEPSYGHVQSYGGAPQALPPIQTFVPQMFEYQGMPMSAYPYSPYVDQTALFNAVLQQLEYYFSMDNLCKDTYLRSHMDKRGFVFLSVVAEFNRMKSMTPDIELLKLACYQSRNIEYRVGADGKDRIRAREGWEKWVVEETQRDVSVKTAGDEELFSPPLPQPQGFEMSGFARTNPLPSPTSPGYTPVYASLNGMSGPVSANPALGTTAPYPYPQHGHSQPSAVNGTNGVSSTDADGSAPSQQPDLELDSFSDEQIYNLSILIKPLETNVEMPRAPSSRVPSGLTESNETGAENSGAEERRRPPRVNGVTSPANSDGQRSQTRDQPPNSASFNLDNGANPVRLVWIKGNEDPSPSVPPDSSRETYTELRAKALQQRHATTCPYDMIVLYQFWSHFLVRNFNRAMYDEFRSLAFEDAQQRTSDTGLRNLIKYYAESLASERPIRERIARHYIDYVRHETDPERPAFKQLRSAWRNGALNFRNRKKISQYVQMDEQLLTALER